MEQQKTPIYVYEKSLLEKSKQTYVHEELAGLMADPTLQKFDLATSRVETEHWNIISVDEILKCAQRTPHYFRIRAALATLLDSGELSPVPHDIVTTVLAEQGMPSPALQSMIANAPRSQAASIQSTNEIVNE